MRAGVKPGLEHAEELSVYLTKKESELTRAKATSTSTSQTPTPEATLGEAPGQVKDKSRSHTLKPFLSQNRRDSDHFSSQNQRKICPIRSQNRRNLPNL